MPNSYIGILCDDICLFLPPSTHQLCWSNIQGLHILLSCLDACLDGMMARLLPIYFIFLNFWIHACGILGLLLVLCLGATPDGPRVHLWC